MTVVSRFLCLVLPVATMTLLTGCTQLNLKKPEMWPFAKEEEPGEPNRIACVWSETVRYKPGEVPMRGFGGRLMFYDNESTDPILVDGTVVVYAFDESNRAPSDARPDRKFVFPAKSLPLHYSESTIGHSYSFWLPWDEAGQERKEVSLITRFLPTQGAPVAVKDPTKLLLPGREPAKIAPREEIAAGPNSPTAMGGFVQPTSYQEPALAEAPETKSRMQTATITVPPRFGQPVVQRAAAPQQVTVPQQVYQAALPAAPAAATPRTTPQPQARLLPGQSRTPAEPGARSMPDRMSWPQRQSVSQYSR